MSTTAARARGDRDDGEHAHGNVGRSGTEIGGAFDAVRYGDLREGGAAGIWSPERRVHRRRAGADDELERKHELEKEERKGEVH